MLFHNLLVYTTFDEKPVGILTIVHYMQWHSLL